MPRLAFALTSPLLLSWSLNSVTTESVIPSLPILTVTGVDLSLALWTIDCGIFPLIGITSLEVWPRALYSAAVLTGDDQHTT